jgi:hypothetical protein
MAPGSGILRALLLPDSKPTATKNDISYALCTAEVCYERGSFLTDFGRILTAALTALIVVYALLYPAPRSPLAGRGNLQWVNPGPRLAATVLGRAGWPHPAARPSLCPEPTGLRSLGYHAWRGNPSGGGGE